MTRTTLNARPAYPAPTTLARRLDDAAYDAAGAAVTATHRPTYRPSAPSAVVMLHAAAGAIAGCDPDTATARVIGMIARCDVAAQELYAAARGPAPIADRRGVIDTARAWHRIADTMDSIVRRHNS